MKKEERIKAFAKPFALYQLCSPKPEQQPQQNAFVLLRLFGYIGQVAGSLAADRVLPGA
jgi:hypothetical protein